MLASNSCSSETMSNDENSTTDHLLLSESFKSAKSESFSNTIDLDAVGRRKCWRQSIFRKISMAPYKISDVSNSGPYSPSPADVFVNGNITEGSSIDDHLAELLKKPTNFYKLLWKKVIFTEISIIRLQKGPVRKNALAAERIRQLKLTYRDMPLPCETESCSIWNKILDHPRKFVLKSRRCKVEDAVRRGIPKYLREKVWPFLLLQYNISLDVVCVPEYNYYDLLKKDSPYIKDILVDLDRTFPEHVYFNQSQKQGQISLYNILKAYACYDTAVGYCQGMSFIAGLILLHMHEETAFDLFVTIMFRLKLRNQYKQDMQRLQVCLYQWSRLLRDKLLDVHDQIETHNVPAVYAAPWFLTLFASTFPLAFSARVLDFLFLTANVDTVFKVALALLGSHKELMLQCGSFEQVNKFLRYTLPDMSIIQMEKIFNDVHLMDISRELISYEVEYEVLQDELGGGSERDNMMISKKECSGLELQKQNSLFFPSMELGLKIDESDVQVLQIINSKLRSQNLELIDKLQKLQQKLKLNENSQKNVQQRTGANDKQALQTACKIIESLKARIKNLENRIKQLETDRNQDMSIR